MRPLHVCTATLLVKAEMAQQLETQLQQQWQLQQKPEDAESIPCLVLRSLLHTNTTAAAFSRHRT
jgi:hypothetical protein